MYRQYNFFMCTWSYISI